jgi:hypothetical protein
MFSTCWLWIGRQLARWLARLLVCGVLGAAIGYGYYQSKFSGPVSPDEQIPSTESADTQAIIEDAIGVVEQHRSDTRVLRNAHAKAHGCVNAEVTVAAELPSSLRYGVCSQPGKTWQAWLRLSNGNAYPQFDRERDARGMGLKLLEVPGAKLLGFGREQDFVMFNHRSFFVRDVAEYRQNFAA